MAATKLIASQDMGGTHSGVRGTIVPGDVGDRMAGHYGKAPPLLSPAMGGAATVPGPTKNILSSINGGSGMRRRVTKGGFGGPAPAGTL